MTQTRDITLSIGGVTYSGWKTVDITLTMESLAGSFNIGLTDNIGVSNKPIRQAPTIIPGKSCKVAVNGQTVITGYIDKVTPIIDANTHTLLIQGRDKTCDLVDCSMTQPISQWKGLTVDQIISRICQPFGIPVTLKGDAGEPFQVFSVEQGATCFESIQKLCYMRQLLALSDGKGGLLLTTSGTDKAQTQLIEGENILSGQADYDFSQRFSDYLCKGQRTATDNMTPTDSSGNFGQDNDNVVPRYRPLMIIADGQASIQDCTQRAKWEAAIRRGRSRKMTISVVGWSQGNGALWGINKLVTIQSILLGVNDTLLISNVNFKMDNNGEITVLTLTSPEAYTLNELKLIKSAALLQSNPFLSA